MNSDCLTHCEIPAVVRTIWNLLCIPCCKYWTSLTSVEKSVDFIFHRDENLRYFNLINEKAMLLLNSVQSVLSAKRISRMLDLQKQNGTEGSHA